MIKCAFYIENAGISHVDYSRIKFANPGIGGTEYMTIMLAIWLTENATNLKVTLYVREIFNSPSTISMCKCLDEKDAISKANDDSTDIFILRYRPILCKPEVFNNPSTNNKMKFIIWAHNFIHHSDLNKIRGVDSVKSIVNVGREQLDLYRDHSMYNKSTYIYNGLSIHKPINCSNNKRENIVTYVGSLHKGKGVHLLTAAWPKIIKSVPDAKLIIIGAGNLYDRGNKMGRFNIAHEDYEEMVLKPILRNGKIIDSVKFLGNLGEEKNDMLLASKIGIPNPSGVSETFGYTAVEMQLCGCQVITSKCCGYMDTVYNKSNLYKDPSKIAEYIIRALDSKNSYDQKEYNSAYQFIYDNFEISIIGNKWIQHISNVFNDKSQEHESHIVNRTFNYKWIREINRQVKSILPFLPSIIFYERVINYIKTFFSK